MDGNSSNHCGYRSCPCRGVNFISRYQDESDYCVDGHRVRLLVDGTVLRATPEQADKLGLALLDQFARYCE